MEDKVSLYGIDVYAHHGVHPAERELGQRFVIDVDLWTDCETAAASDSLNQALDYTAVHACINETTAGTSFQLIEALAGHLCRILLESFPVGRVRMNRNSTWGPLMAALWLLTGTTAVSCGMPRSHPKFWCPLQRKMASSWSVVLTGGSLAWMKTTEPGFGFTTTACRY